MSNEYFCPNCDIELNSISSDNGMYYQCSKCKGKLVSTVSFKRQGLPNFSFNKMWTEARSQLQHLGKMCPSCNRAMAKIVTPFEPNIELDICPTCMLFWFDEGEYEKIPFVKDENPSQKELEEEKIEMIYQKVRAKSILKGEIEYEPESIKVNNFPPSFIVAVFSFLGLPYEAEKTVLENIPIVTWSFSLLCVIIYIIFINDRYESIDIMGFRPNLWYKDFGITIFTSMLLHASFWHLLSNLYFLIIFGDDVEDMLGRGKYILLIFASHIFGLFVHSVFGHYKSIPMVGASVAISGILGYYIVFFPKRQIGFMLRVFYMFKWIQIPAWLYFGFWIIIQIFGVINQVSHGSDVSYLGHFGGIVFGIFIGLMAKARELDRLEKI